MITRRLDWRTRLQLWSTAQVGRPFVWGETDCGALARAAMLELFGQDAVAWLPTWSSAREALTVLRDHGPFNRILERTGAATTTLPFARSGDLIVCAAPEEEVGHEGLVVCLDGPRCLGSSREGVVRVLLPAMMPQCTVYSLWGIQTDG